MNRRDLLKLKENIYSLGETISEQEGFYRDVNGFLRQVYPTLPNAASKMSTKSHFSSSNKSYWPAPSADVRTNHTSVPNL